MMSKHVGTRSPIQCRSHHQKMMQTFKTPEGVVAHFLKKAENETEVTYPEEFSEQFSPLVKLEVKKEPEVLEAEVKCE
jgi:hypothetical protein